MPNQDNLEKLFKQHREKLLYPMPTPLKNMIREKYFTKPVTAWWIWASGGALAAGLALIIAFQSGLLRNSDSESEFLIQEISSAHVRSLMAQHLADVLSTDQHTVKPWFEGRLDFAPMVKNLADHDFPLIGGRLDYVGGRPVAALIYKHHLHIINVMQWPSAVAHDTSLKFIERRGYQIFTWQKAGMTYWVISDLNAVDLQKFTWYLH